MNKTDLAAIWENQTISISSFPTVLVTLLIAFAIGVFIFWIYKMNFRGVMYSQNYALSLVLLCIITAPVVLCIRQSLALSLGMVGALSIVRYRTAVKDPMDLLYLFWAVADGIAIGAGMFYIALLVMAIMTVLLLVLRRRKGPRDEMYILLVHYDGAGVEETIRRAFGTCPYKIMSKTLRKKDVEMAVELRLKHNNLSLLDTLRAVEGVLDATLVQYGGDYID